MKPKTLAPLALALLLVVASLCSAATPAPAVQTRFALPLTDGTQAQAFILAAPDGASYLVYATAAGDLVVLPLGKTQVDPIPPNPTPGKKKIAVIEDPSRSTWAVRQVLAEKSWRNFATQFHTFLGVIPADLIDPETLKPPPRLEPAIKAASGHALPVLVILDQNNQPIRVLALPTSAADLLATLKTL
jgi:hypothetical protein